ncbi:hypothetical protein GCM10025869_21730 [Homoserinibacter gongjuensis]|uniref:Uncharacterized protein n=1 Tax=Homoserinibacter gongjuensis TaxID=1162968 RepID=A0ABQ6JWL7_9MICO|nr:hypothetical protein GCM10025869_21730 [Homoserinibacter gongjuensis]
MGEHDDERHIQQRNRILERRDRRVGDHVTGVAHDEQVAEPLVEDDLGRQPGVAASEERDVRLLESGQLLAPLDVLSWVSRGARDEPLIAAHHLPPRVRGGAAGVGVGGGHASSFAIAVARNANSASSAVPASTMVESSVVVTSA